MAGRLDRWAGAGWMVLVLACAPGVAAAQPFPQGVCGGLLCSAIGGSTAPPKPPGPPPNCGGLFCGSIGDPFYPPGTAPQVAAAPPPPPPAAPAPRRSHKRHARTHAAVRHTPAPKATE